MSFLKKLNPIRAIKRALRNVRKVAGWLLGIPKPQDPKALEVTRKGSDHALPVVYGERRIGAVEVHMFSTSTVTGLPGIISKNETNAYLHIAAAFCHGEIEGFQEFFFDGVSSTDPRFSGRFKIITRNGAPDEEAIPEAVANIPNWHASMRGRHVAYAYIVLYQGKDETVWRGEPDITARIKGKKLYDPRTGVTAYSENNALASLDYLRNNIYGRGLSESQIHLPAFVAAANFCDEGTTSEVTYTRCYNDDDPTAPPICRTYTETVSQPRYKIAAVMDTSALVLDNYKELLQSFRAFPRRPNGLVSLGVETTGTPVMTFDEDDLIGSIVFSKSGQRDRYNRFTIRFPNRLDNFERDEIAYPQPDDPLYDTWLAEDNGKELLGELELNTLADKSGAAQTAEIAAKRSRINGSLKIEAGAKARLLEEGDIFGINSYSFGWSNKPFRLEKLSESEDGTFEIEAVEHENSIYPWSGSEWAEQVGGSWLGNPSAPKAPGNLQFFPDPTLSTAGLLTWEAVNDAFVRSYEVVILDDQGEPIPTGLENSTRGTRYDIPVLDVGEYTVHAYSVTTLGFRSSPATLSLTLSLPVAPDTLGLSSSNTTVTSEPALADAGIGTEFHFDIDDLSDGDYTPTPRMRGASAVFTGKLPNTEYRVWVRSSNAYGESPWVSGTITTTADIREIEPVVNELPVIVRQVREVDSLRYRFNIEQLDRKGSDAALLAGMVDAWAQKQELARRQANNETLIGALFRVNPLTGEIENLAFSYTDNSFSQAALRIDGVEGSVSILSQRITFGEAGIENLQSQIDLVPGMITLTATAIVSNAMAALEPAHAFNFYGSAQGWFAVNGSITSQSNYVDLVWGDIQSNDLDYDAEENPALRISITRLTGEGWVGDVIITRTDNSTETFTAAIDDVLVSNQRNLDFAGDARYTGQIKSMRLILGASAADTFEINAITIGKLDAAQQDIENLTARVGVAETRIDAQAGLISDRVTVTYYQDNTVTLSEFTSVLNADQGFAEVKGVTQQIEDDGTISKAAQAATFIDSYSGTFAAYAQSVSQQISDLDDDIGFVSTTVSLRLDAAEGEITSQVRRIYLLDQSTRDALVHQLLALVEFGLFKLGTNENDIIYANAIDQLKVDVGPDGALARSIQGVEATSNVNGQTITATSALLQEVINNPFGTSIALAQLDATINSPQGLVSAFSQFNVEFDAVTGRLLARSFFGTETGPNGEPILTGVTVEDDGVSRSIRFNAPNVYFYNPFTEQDDLYYDAAKNRITIRANLILGDGTPIDSVTDIERKTQFTEFRYRRAATQPIRPTALEPVSWSTAIPSSTETLWIIEAQKLGDKSAFVAGSTWSVPALFSGKDGDNGANGQSVLVVYAADSLGSDQSLTVGARRFVQYYEYVGATPSLPVGGLFVEFVGKDGEPAQGVWPIYASDSDGTGQSFSSAGKKWVTFYESVTEPALPVTDATFVKYVGEDGDTGSAGASINFVTLSGNEPAQIDQQQLTDALETAVGRLPVKGDSLLVTWDNNSIGYSYSGTTWSQAAITLNGAFIATDSVSAPILTGDALYGKRQVISTGSTAADIQVVTDPGDVELDSELIYWVGPGDKVTKASRTKDNAIAFLGKNGSYARQTDIQMLFEDGTPYNFGRLFGAYSTRALDGTSQAGFIKTGIPKSVKGIALLELDMGIVSIDVNYDSLTVQIIRLQGAGGLVVLAERTISDFNNASSLKKDTVNPVRFSAFEDNTGAPVDSDRRYGFRLIGNTSGPSNSIVYLAKASSVSFKSTEVRQ